MTGTGSSVSCVIIQFGFTSRPGVNKYNPFLDPECPELSENLDTRYLGYWIRLILNTIENLAWNLKNPNNGNPGGYWISWRTWILDTLENMDTMGNLDTETWRTWIFP